MNSEQKHYLNGTELEIGQVWQCPYGETEGRIIGFNSDGIAVIEIVKTGSSSAYDLKDVRLFSNPLWVLQPKKKKIQYRVFKSLTTGSVTVLSGDDMEAGERYTDAWVAISPRMEYEYVER